MVQTVKDKARVLGECSRRSKRDGRKKAGIVEILAWRKVPKVLMTRAPRPQEENLPPKQVRGIFSQQKNGKRDHCDQWEDDETKTYHWQ